MPHPQETAATSGDTTATSGRSPARRILAYTQPRIARNLLRVRHSMLPRARERARELRQRGAMFPWRTIKGEEASAYYQAGTAQCHINADIASAIRR
jgi:alpha,alpha-trehalose phosphorylase